MWKAVGVLRRTDRFYFAVLCHQCGACRYSTRMAKSDGKAGDSQADDSGVLKLAEKERKRQKMLDSGFTEAEIMAMEFSQEHG